MNKIQNLNLVFFAIGLLLCSPTAGKDLSKLSVAIHCEDNDLSISKKSEGSDKIISNEVKSVILKLVEEYEKDLKEHEKENGNGFTYSYGPVYYIKNINLPDVYILRVDGPFGLTEYIPILFEPSSGSVTKDPPSIWGKWMGRISGFNPLEKPIVFFEDLDGTGNKDLVFQEQVHNGTMYNAVIYKYFRIDRELNLKMELALEAKLDRLENDGIYIRKIEERKKDHLKIGVFSQDEGKAPEAVGYFEIERSSAGNPFKVTNKKFTNSEDEKQGTGFLISLMAGQSDETENKFIGEGYTFHY